MKVRLSFNVSESGLPALVIIRNFSGRLILYRKVFRRQNRLCFSTCDRNVIITVRPYDAGLYEKSYFIKLRCVPCQNLDLYFNFTPVTEILSPQNFYLYDENYRFPISDAVLYFTGGGTLTETP